MIEWIDSFIRYLDEQKKYSEHTQIAYQLDLKELAHFMESRFDVLHPKNVTQDQLRDWQMHLREQKLRSNSISRKLSTVRAFFSFLLQNGRIDYNPTVHLISPRKEADLPRTVAKSRLIQILNHLSEEDRFSEQRDYIILLLLYACGLRRSEVTGLRLADLDSNTTYLRVKGKGNKERLIPIEQKLTKALVRYINLRKETFPNSIQDYLLLTNKGQPIYDKFVYRIVQKYFSDGQHGKVHPHLIRHSFATHLLENGAKIEYVRKLLGHSSLAATQVYTHMNLTQMKKIYADTHPRKDL
jgi:integrase/recombinase XerC